MRIRTLKKASALIAIGLVASIITAPASRAETFVFQSGPLTNLDPAGATIRGGFSSFPAGVGMYIQQCIAPVGTARPVTCSDTIQLWVSDSGERGTVSSKGDISLKVATSITGKGVTVDCTITSCGLFFRLDHTKSTDLSQDKFMAISFRAGTAAPALAADEITVTLNGKTLVRNVPGQLAYQAPGAVVAVAKSGLAVTLSSLTSDCVYSNGKFTALKGAGQCALAHSTAGSATIAPSSANYPFILIPGTQEISALPKSMKIKSSKALPAETTFGSAITYTPLGEKCTVTGGVVTSTKRGTCVLRAKADAKAGMWNALSTVVKVAITK